MRNDEKAHIRDIHAHHSESLLFALSYQNRNLTYQFCAHAANWGFVRIPDYAGEAFVVDSVALKFVAYHSWRGPGVRILSATPTKNLPSTQVCKQFTDRVRLNRGMG